MNSKKSAPCGPKSWSTVVAGKKRIRSTSVYVWLSPDEQVKSGSVWRMWVSVIFRSICAKWILTAMCSMLTLLLSKTLFLYEGGVRIISIK